jgi:hypothetical protein
LQGVDEPGDLLARADLADQRVERAGVVVGRHDAQRAECPDHEQRDDQHRASFVRSRQFRSRLLRRSPTVDHPPARPTAGRMVPRRGVIAVTASPGGRPRAAAGPACVRTAA